MTYSNQPDVKIYAGDPKTNPTKVKVISISNSGQNSVTKVCGLEFKQGVSMAASGFDSFSADVPAKILFFTQTKVPKRILSEFWSKIVCCSGTHDYQHDRFEFVQLRKGTATRSILSY
jgi:hypothetical protein